MTDLRRDRAAYADDVSRRSGRLRVPVFAVEPGPGPTRSRRAAFVLFAWLKGAVPILLGSFLLAASVPGAQRLYGIIAVALMFSVVVQGSLVPAAARLLRVPMRPVAPEPWALRVRLAAAEDQRPVPGRTSATQMGAGLSTAVAESLSVVALLAVLARSRPVTRSRRPGGWGR